MREARGSRGQPLALHEMHTWRVHERVEVEPLSLFTVSLEGFSVDIVIPQLYQRES